MICEEYFSQFIHGIGAHIQVNTDQGIQFRSRARLLGKIVLQKKSNFDLLTAFDYTMIRKHNRKETDMTYAYKKIYMVRI